MRHNSSSNHTTQQEVQEEKKASTRFHDELQLMSSIEVGFGKQAADPSTYTHDVAFSNDDEDQTLLFVVNVSFSEEGRNVFVFKSDG